MSFEFQTPTGFSPCGAIFAASNRFYSAPCKTYADDTTRSNRIRWYVAPVGAIHYPHFHAFTPGIDRLDDTHEGLMEFVLKRTNQRSYNAGANIFGTDGAHWHGDEDDFLGRSPRRKYWRVEPRSSSPRPDTLIAFGSELIDPDNPSIITHCRIVFSATGYGVIPPENPCGVVETSLSRFVFGHVGFVLAEPDETLEGFVFSESGYDPSTFAGFVFAGTTAYAPASYYTSTSAFVCSGQTFDVPAAMIVRSGGAFVFGSVLTDPDVEIVEVVGGRIAFSGATLDLTGPLAIRTGGVVVFTGTAPYVAVADELHSTSGIRFQTDPYHGESVSGIRFQTDPYHGESVSGIEFTGFTEDAPEEGGGGGPSCPAAELLVDGHEYSVTLASTEQRFFYLPVDAGQAFELEYDIPSGGNLTVYDGPRCAGDNHFGALAGTGFLDCDGTIITGPFLEIWISAGTGFTPLIVFRLTLT